jgi:hypothetical protein
MNVNFDLILTSEPTREEPNAETRAAMKDADEKCNLTRHTSLEALWGDLDGAASDVEALAKE